jgi:hypothetical protein
VGGMSMVKKIINFIFPVRALPKDEKARAIVISKYEYPFQLLYIY